MNCAARAKSLGTFIARWWLRRIASGNVRTRFFLFTICNGARQRILVCKKSGFIRCGRRRRVRVCGERVKPGVAVCKSCHAILDREKALALGLGQAPADGCVR